MIPLFQFFFACFSTIIFLYTQAGTAFCPYLVQEGKMNGNNLVRMPRMELYLRSRGYTERSIREISSLSVREWKRWTCLERLKLLERGHGRPGGGAGGAIFMV
jgi:hypothetical protein